MPAKPSTLDVPAARPLAGSGGRLRLAAPLPAVLLAGVLPWWLDAGWLNTLTEFFYFVALAQAWNLLAGYAGVMSLGQQAFVGLGGYALFATVILLGLGPWAGLLAAGLGCALLALPMAAVLFRLRGAQMAIGSWVLAEVARLLVARLEVFGGNAGTSLPLDAAAALEQGGLPLDSVLYLLALVLCVGVHVFVYGLLRSRAGLALTAVRDNEEAARSSGVATGRLKWGVYVSVAAATGLLGALIYLTKFRITPGAAFDMSWTTYAIFIVVIGGVGTLEGPIVGALLFFVLRQYLSDLGTWYLILLGAIAVAVMLWLPRGLWGTLAPRLRLQIFPTRRLLSPPAAPPSYPS